MKQSFYRPALSAARGDAEKVRCGEIFAFKGSSDRYTFLQVREGKLILHEPLSGGKCLPQELTIMASEAPFEREQKMRDIKINSSYKVVEGQTVKVVPKANWDENRAPAVLTLGDQIVSEIEERRVYLEEMKGALRQEDVCKVKAEISMRLQELKRVESGSL
jgi:Uncharacterised protein family (UPF0193)